MTTRRVEHLDATGAPCARHPAAPIEGLLQLALVGSRAPAFHHDCASKLQGLVMALDELGELTEGAGPDVLRAIEGAISATRDLNALLNTNRALTKPPTRTDITLRELMTRAAQRVGVALQGAVPEATLSVAVPTMTHALALVLDVAAGAGRGRTLALVATLAGREVELELVTAPTPPSGASELLEIATFVIARDSGRLWCATAGERLYVRLPITG